MTKRIKLFKVHNIPTIGEEIQKIWDSGAITEGVQSDKFEEKFSTLINNKNTALVNSGTSALTLAYRLADIKAGDEVISSPMTCAATNEPLANIGAKIVWADIDPNTGNLDPSDVAKKTTSKTKAVVGVHWGGIPFSAYHMQCAASKYDKVTVIQDAAHALGAKLYGKIIGSPSTNFGYCCFSFQAIKHLSTGDGGAIAVRLDEQFERVKRLRWFGLSRKNVPGKSRWEQDILESGYKMHMNNINATIGILQMNYIDKIIKAHIKNANFYQENINNKLVKKPVIPKHTEPSWWLYTLRVDDRKKFKKHLDSYGIDNDIVHNRNDVYSCFSGQRHDPSSLPGVTEFNNTHICIPVGWWLTDKELEKVVECVNKYK